MMKSPQSATKLRLSRIIRSLVVIGSLKMVILSAAIFDLPIPEFWTGDKESRQVAATGAEYSAPVFTEAAAPEQRPQDEAQPSGEMPMGSAAAELAASAKPRRVDNPDQAALPAPLVPASRISPLAHEGTVFVAPAMPEPPALDAPLARAGVVVPEPTNTPKKSGEDSIWDSLALNSLPIPGLGSVRAAHAASLDMPVPSAPAPNSPFAPAEQIAPLTAPGSAPLPGGIPSAVGPDGSPIPPRYDGAQNALPPLPETPRGAATPPAPQIQPRTSSLDANAKSQELARQQQDILMLRQQMDQRMKDLQTAEDKMKDMLKEAKTIEDKKVKSLVQMYANMKPRMAAQALENMDERIAVRILGGMAPKQSGEILTYTNPAKTAKFTEMITRMRMSD